MAEFGIKRGIILTYDREMTLKHKGHTVSVVPVWKWMLSSETSAARRRSHDAPVTTQ